MGLHFVNLTAIRGPVNLNGSCYVITFSRLRGAAAFFRSFFERFSILHPAMSRLAGGAALLPKAGDL